jgi:hypothetical protein
VSNGTHSQKDFSDLSRMFAIYTSSDAVGDYSMSMREDTESVGPDGKLGVMAVSWETIPKHLGYCTFVYSGKQAGEAFNFAPIVNAKSAPDLAEIQFRFRFKGVNTSLPEKVNFAFDLRLGFEGDEYENRLDLGRVTVTDAWQKHFVDLGERPNVNNFLKSASQRGDMPLRLEISQVGSIDSYRAGDTLLIDDVEVIIPQRLVTTPMLRSITKSEWIDYSVLDPTQIVFSDSFADVKGSVLQITNGTWKTENFQVDSRSISMFVDPKPMGDYKIKFAEDPKTIGPDGKPGVLALAWDLVPQRLGYSGFMYMGSRMGAGFEVAQVNAAQSKDDLAGIYVRFKCKGINLQTARPDGIKVGFRIEPNNGDQFANRLDFGTIRLTDGWTNYQRELSEGKNAAKFLQSVARNRENGIRLIWSQVGGSDGYRSGDTVMIDDIELIVFPSVELP